MRAPLAAVAAVAVATACTPPTPQPPRVDEPVADAAVADAAPPPPPPLVLDERIDVEPSPAPQVLSFSAPVFDPPAPDPKALPRDARACVAAWRKARLDRRAAQRAFAEARRADGRALDRARAAADKAERARVAQAATCLPRLAGADLDVRGTFALAVMQLERALDLELDASPDADAPSGEAARRDAVATAVRCEATGDDAAVHAQCARLAGDTLADLGDDAAAEAALGRALAALPGLAADQVRLQLAGLAAARDDVAAAVALADAITDPAVVPAAATQVAQDGWRLGDCDAVWRAGARCRARGDDCNTVEELGWFEAACLADPAAGADRATRLPALDPDAVLDPERVAAREADYAAPADPVVRLRWAAATCARDRLAPGAARLTLTIGGTTAAPTVTPDAAGLGAARVAACTRARYAETTAAGERSLTGRIVLVR